MWVIFLRATLIAAAIATAAIGFAAPALADTGDDAYEAMPRHYGLDPYDGNPRLKLGHAVCDDLENGATAADETATLNRVLLSSFTTEDAGHIVTATQLKLCPSTLGD